MSCGMGHALTRLRQSVPVNISTWLKNKKKRFDKISFYAFVSCREKREREGVIADGVEDEEKWLSAGIAGLQQNDFHMHRALDSNNLKDALTFSAQMLSELRTSRLSPHKYYELCLELGCADMRAFDELRKFEIFFKEETGRGCSIVELYELVQYAGNILPRLYLLCTVGCVYIKSKEAPAKDVLKDLVEMCRGIQHPLRGLFLRSYLSQVSKDKLPDIGSEYEGDADTVMDAVEFVLQNFTEMNKLWVRMQHQGPTREKEKREKERSELRDLVGKNLHVLSQIEGVDLEMYKEIVLPTVLEQVVNCKDELAQYYLMDCIIQVFPDEYHLQTLETLLNACPQLQPSVDVKTVLARLMERLSNYAASGAEVIEAQENFPIAGVVTLYASLLTFTLQVHPDRLDYVDQILGACVNKLSGREKLDDSKATKKIVALLSAPLEKYKDIDIALKLSNYPRVMEHLNNETKKEMASVIIQNIMKHKACISTAEKVDALFELIKGLIRESDEDLRDEVLDEDFKEEQNSVARLIQMLQSDDPEEMLKIIDTVRKHISTGGRKRLPHTVPPLIFSSLKLVRRLEDRNEGVSGDEASAIPKKIFQLVTQTIDTLSKLLGKSIGLQSLYNRLAPIFPGSIPVPELALGLYLQCAEAADNFDLEPVAYEFFTQAYILYEEESTDSKAQVTSLHLIIGTLQRMHVFGVENRDALTHKATGYSAKLLKKPDNVELFMHVLICSGLTNMTVSEMVRGVVLLCLKRALRIANAIQQMANATRGNSGSVLLLVEILNKYLYFYEKGVPQITVESIKSLVELIRNEMLGDNNNMPSDQAADAFFASTLQYIQFQKDKGGAVGEKYKLILI
ncbi:vacuolar protein sorting-associated protein [Striga asiatica]|uniref:Vacuolar protein sorting-associated protein 35 n=1 Tax=Striga asiatica TaxID=4170 RepID=A0A5A7P0D1_STRAF|nr:vacuolar protein sorting-associated protein [Striga asiatica]